MLIFFYRIVFTRGFFLCSAAQAWILKVDLGLIFNETKVERKSISLIAIKACVGSLAKDTEKHVRVSAVHLSFILLFYVLLGTGHTGVTPACQSLWRE